MFCADGIEIKSKSDMRLSLGLYYGKMRINWRFSSQGRSKCCW
jgi:hypothetical protein